MEFDLLQRLKYASQLTSQEKHIVDYILKDPEVVFYSTAHELAQQTLTSASTIVRLCKKLGTQGYPDFQLKLALQYRQTSSSMKAEKEPPLQQGDIQAVIDSVPYLYGQALDDTRRSLNLSTLTKIADWVKRADRIDIYGSDTNYYIAQQACIKWNELGIAAIPHNHVNQHYLLTLKPDTSTLSFIVSNTGENRSMIEVAASLRDKNMNTVAVTSANDSTLAALCTETLLTHGYHEQLRLSKMSSMISTLYLFDMLYMSSITDTY
ncbi:MurR/RpiR family transcriptional regulator [Saccharibacillus sp. JS10]|uniref:MurR/RpiR family transcriptional regulator n=1 Tax=Saccharibacillus sp. JS10 TaxID=2950552 RepID=UPI00210A6073|nr:MurR/RpiR family transcriptional regulator [Saccharibacillus sp. JS10]MCQ4086405.1 MurR/RpiR family transcriptional regulator [Saccharibacillus sp. JS10]